MAGRRGDQPKASEGAQKGAQAPENGAERPHSAPGDDQQNRPADAISASDSAAVEKRPKKKRKGGGNGARARKRAERIRGEIPALPDEVLGDILQRLQAERARRRNGGKQVANNIPMQFDATTRAMVESLAGHGLARDQIALLVKNPDTGEPISTDTLEHHFSEELSVGLAKMNATLAQAYFRTAMGHSAEYAADGRKLREEALPVPSMLIFAMKARFGWREPSLYEKLLGNEELDRLIRETESAISSKYGSPALIAGNTGSAEEAEGASGAEGETGFATGRKPVPAVSH